MLAANTRSNGSSLWQCHAKPYRDTYRYSHTYNYANTDGDGYGYGHCNTNTNGKAYSDSEVYSHAERAPDSKTETVNPHFKDRETINGGPASLKTMAKWSPNAPDQVAEPQIFLSTR